MSKKKPAEPKEIVITDEEEEEESECSCCADWCGNPAYPHCMASCKLYDD